VRRIDLFAPPKTIGSRSSGPELGAGDNLVDAAHDHAQEQLDLHRPLNQQHDRTGGEQPILTGLLAGQRDLLLHCSKSVHD
jgi:hypothetical protein